LFTTAMAIVWTNKGIVLQTRRNLHRSLTCYSLARGWMCHIIATASSTDLDGGDDNNNNNNKDGSSVSHHVIRRALSQTIGHNTDKLLLEIGSGMIHL
jgi:hypothetical protein